MSIDKRRCTYCYGSGIQMGGGGLKEDCSQCKEGYVYSVDPVVDEKAKIDWNTTDKRSTQYKHAIAKIMAADTKLSKAEADKYLREGLANNG